MRTAVLVSHPGGGKEERKKQPLIVSKDHLFFSLLLLLLLLLRLNRVCKWKEGIPDSLFYSTVNFRIQCSIVYEKLLK